MNCDKISDVIYVQLLNHGISHELMDEVERVTKAHYKGNSSRKRGS